MSIGRCCSTIDPMQPIWNLIANPDIEQSEELAVEQESQLEPPWRVLIHNDDVTTFDFVIRILTGVFALNVMLAEQIAFAAHSRGVAVVGRYPRSEAESKVNKAHFAAQLEGFPLRFTLEPEEE